MFEITTNQQEKTQHQMADLPLAFYHRSFLKERGDTIIPHWHPEFQIVGVLKGTLHYTVEGEKFLLSAGNILFINSKRLHSASCKSPQVEFICLDFSSEFIHPATYHLFIANLEQNQALNYSLITPTKELQQLLAIILKTPWCWQEQGLPLYNFILASLTLVTRKKNKEATEPNSEIAKLLTFIQTHYQKELTVTEIAQAVAVNNNKCTQLFKTYTGLSPINYLIAYRLNKAKEALLNSDLSISEICFQTGFNHLSYFSQRFFKEYHYTPLNYRKKFK